MRRSPSGVAHAAPSQLDREQTLSMAGHRKAAKIAVVCHAWFISRHPQSEVVPSPEPIGGIYEKRERQTDTHQWINDAAPHTAPKNVERFRNPKPESSSHASGKFISVFRLAFSAGSSCPRWPTLLCCIFAQSRTLRLID